jgi:hypothetical protein
VKKAILIVAALMLVISGVAAVSAYEAHIINVKAHVENALTVDTTEIDFGTVFPEEWFVEERGIALSTSAVSELDDAAGGALVSVDYKICAEYKVMTPGDPPVYYRWLGDWLWVGIDTDAPTPADQAMPAGWELVGPEPDKGYDPQVGPAVMATCTSLTGQLTAANPDDVLKVMLLTPVFHGYYNPDTDVKPDWWPLGRWPVLQGDPEGEDLGVDLKVQVTDITRADPVP